MEVAGRGCRGSAWHSQGCYRDLAYDSQAQGIQLLSMSPGLRHFTSSCLSFLICEKGENPPCSVILRIEQGASVRALSAWEAPSVFSGPHINPGNRCHLSHAEKELRGGDTSGAQKGLGPVFLPLKLVLFWRGAFLQGKVFPGDVSQKGTWVVQNDSLEIPTSLFIFTPMFQPTHIHRAGSAQPQRGVLRVGVARRF